MKNRDYTRVDYAAGASISYDNQVAICTTGNLSLRGMYLKTGHEIPLDTPAHVTVYNPDLSSFKVGAKVVWSEENGVGLQITDLNVDSFARLRDLVAEQSKDQGAILQETCRMLKCIH